MRLSRKVMIGLGVVAGLGVGGALILALQGRSGRDAPSELYSTDRNPQADGLANLPRDYAAFPSLVRRCRAISAGRSCVRRSVDSPCRRRP